MREMKDSGVEWIGEIPRDWRVLRNKNLFFEINERCLSGDDFQLLSVSEYYGVAPKIDRIEDGDMITYAESLEGYKICKQDDIVMNIMLAWKRATGVSNFDGIISPAYCVYRAKKNANPHYYHYLFRTDVIINLFKQYSTGVIDSRLRLYSDKFFSLPMIVPPIKEQLKISTYLDTICSRIDAIIAREQAVIKKLKDYKLSIITEAVTKGLNPDVPMKDSGVEWIGKIPKSWSTIKLKNTAEIMRGKFSHRPRNDPDYYDGKYPFVQTGDVARADKYLSHYSQTLNELGYSVSKEFPQGSIVMTIAANVGDVAVLSFDACFPDSVVGFIPNSNIHWNYLFYVLKAMKNQLMRNAIISTQMNLNIEIIKDETVPKVPYEEQLSIVKFLDEKNEKINYAITYKQSLITKLTEYKKSLIYEVVTGKKEV